MEEKTTTLVKDTSAVEALYTQLQPQSQGTGENIIVGPEISIPELSILHEGVVFSQLED